MTQTIHDPAPGHAPVPMPGETLASSYDNGGWEKHADTDPRDLPVVPLAPESACPRARAPRNYRRPWMCTGHMPGWHIATAMHGHAVAVWPEGSEQR